MEDIKNYISKLYSVFGGENMHFCYNICTKVDNLILTEQGEKILVNNIEYPERLMFNWL